MRGNHPRWCVFRLLADYAERELTVRLQLWREPESKNGIIHTGDWGKKIDSPSTWGGTWVDTATWVSHETVVQIEYKTSMDDKEVAVLVEHAVLKEKKAFAKMKAEEEEVLSLVPLQLWKALVVREWLHAKRR